MRERDRKTYTMVWVVVTAALVGILLLIGSGWWALALLLVLVGGLVAWLRVTHPGGPRKPPLGIFLPDAEGEAPAWPSAHSAPPPPPSTAGDVVRLRSAPAAPVPPTVEPEPEPEPVAEVPAPAAGDEDEEAAEPAAEERILAVSQQAAIDDIRNTSDEVAHHQVRLLKKVQAQLQGYE